MKNQSQFQNLIEEINNGNFKALDGFNFQHAEDLQFLMFSIDFEKNGSFQENRDRFEEFYWRAVDSLHDSFDSDDLRDDLVIQGSDYGFQRA